MRDTISSNFSPFGPIRLSTLGSIVASVRVARDMYPPSGVLHQKTVASFGIS